MLKVLERDSNQRVEGGGGGGKEREKERYVYVHEGVGAWCVPALHYVEEDGGKREFVCIGV